MRISDWSSDVCSSDLRRLTAPHRDQQVVENRHALEELRRLIGARDAGARHPMGAPAGQVALAEVHAARIRSVEASNEIERSGLSRTVRTDAAGDQIGRASGRERVCQYV